MRITYDPKADAAYIYLVDQIPPGGVRGTYACNPKEVNGQINLDFDSEGRLLAATASVQRDRAAWKTEPTTIKIGC